MTYFQQKRAYFHTNIAISTFSGLKTSPFSTLSKSSFLFCKLFTFNKVLFVYLQYYFYKISNCIFFSKMSLKLLSSTGANFCYQKSHYFIYHKALLFPKDKNMSFLPLKNDLFALFKKPFFLSKMDLFLVFLGKRNKTVKKGCF